MRLARPNKVSIENRACKVAPVCAFTGSILLLAGTYLHPVPSDANNAAQAFAAYAADRFWIASHLMQLVGTILALAVLLIVAEELETKGSRLWLRLGSAGAVGSIALVSALQAVDGIALRKMVQSWAAAPATQREIAFQSAFAVRQVEIGFACVLSILLGGTAILYGVALLDGHTYPRWVGALGIFGGVPTLLSGVVMAFRGFSALEMAISMPASLMLVIWLMVLGVLMWRRGGQRKDRCATAP
jgi:hypothetical protein